MRIALLGDNLDVVPFLTALIDSGRHELVGTVLAPRCTAKLRGVPTFSSWQGLVPEPIADTVLIAEGTPEVQEAARQLAAVDKRLLVWPTGEMSSEFVYQLTLIHAEQRLVLLPLLPLRIHPAVERVHDLLRQQALGRVQHLRLDAAVRPTRGTGFSPRCLAQRFLADVDLLRSFGGEYDRISASRSGHGTHDVHLATATLTGEACPQALWSLTAAPEEAWAFTVAGERGTLTLSASGDPLARDVQLRVTGMALTESRGSEAGWEEQLVAQCDGLQTGVIALPSWSDLAKLFELREAFDRSHERARTIALHFDAPTERAVFKSQMAAAGCSVLVFTLLAVILFLGLSASVPLPPFAKHVVPWVIFAPLGVYLLLQLLILLTRLPASDPLPKGAEQTGSGSVAG